MKKILAIGLAGVLLLGGMGAVAAGGSAGDPLITLRYLPGTYRPALMQAIDEKVAAMGSGEESGRSTLAQLAQQILARAEGESAPGYAHTYQEQRFKEGDVITLEAGSSMVLLAGGARMTVPAGGAVIDLTAGAEVASGAALEESHRYLSGENTVCTVTVTTATAVLAPQGYYAVAESDAVDYNELAAALQAMGVVRGSNISYGSGYELERQPNRVEGLIMFLRLTGQEEAALSYTGPCPFNDVPSWCESYVAYAADRGYVEGYGDGRYGTKDPMTGKQFIALLLRILEYSEEGSTPDFTYNTAISSAKALGVITAGEEQLLSSGTFLRAQMLYFSYYALEAKAKGSSVTLLQELESAGVITDAAEIVAAVENQRLP